MAVDELRIRTRAYSAYVRDRWSVSPKLTLSYGVRWEYFPFPTRAERGLERYDTSTNEMLLCGVGSISRGCGNEQSKKLFAPRIGLAYGATNRFVARAGYGLTYDPFNVGRDLEGTYPSIYAQNVPYVVAGVPRDHLPGGRTPLLDGRSSGLFEKAAKLAAQFHKFFPVGRPTDRVDGLPRIVSQIAHSLPRKWASCLFW